MGIGISVFEVSNLGNVLMKQRFADVFGCEGSSLRAVGGCIQCDRLSNLRTEVKQTRLRATPCVTLELTLRQTGQELQGSRCAATITSPHC